MYFDNDNKIRENFERGKFAKTKENKRKIGNALRAKHYFQKMKTCLLLQI